MKQQAITIKLKPIDWITLIFCFWMLLLIGFGWNRIHNPLPFFIGYFTIVAATLLLIWFKEFMKEQSKPENCPSEVCKVVRPKIYNAVAFVRSYYPVTLYLFFFLSVSVTNKVFFSDWLDPFFQSIDFAIFGYLPSMEWGLRFDNIWFKEWIYFSYFSYYLMIIWLPVIFYRKHREAMDEMVFVLSFVFYFCYFIFSWLPVVGGRYIPLAMEMTRQANGGIFTAIMAFIYTNSPHMGGAFPSSHIAIALVLSLLAFKYFRKLGYLFLFLTAFLSFATVYCHYHWFIDAVFGVLTGFLGYWVAQVLFRKLSERTK
jgi:membrane-associated phospholipid phosphatase